MYGFTNVLAFYASANFMLYFKAKKLKFWFNYFIFLEILYCPLVFQQGVKLGEQILNLKQKAMLPVIS